MEVAFKKKAPRKAGGRKRSRREADAEDADADAAGGASEDKEDTLGVIEQVLEDQRLRAQVLKQEAAGRAAGDARGSSSARGKAAAASDSAEYGLHDPKKDGSAGQKLLTLLDGQFTGQSSATQQDPHEQLLEKYIEEKLHRKRAEEAGDAGGAAPAVSEEDALFALPDHLNPRKSQAAAPEDDESASGGVLIWNTGIAEVELPETFAQQTARATQRALQQQEAARAARTRGANVDSSALPANFSTDFNRHRSDFVAELKTMRKDEQRERGFRKVGKNQPGDDAAVSRFRKFESRKMRR